MPGVGHGYPEDTRFCTPALHPFCMDEGVFQPCDHYDGQPCGLCRFCQSGKTGWKAARHMPGVQKALYPCFRLQVALEEPKGVCG